MSGLLRNDVCQLGFLAVSGPCFFLFCILCNFLIKLFLGKAQSRTGVYCWKLGKHYIGFVYSWDRDDKHHTEIWASPPAETPWGHRYDNMVGRVISEEMRERCLNVFHPVSLRRLFKSLSSFIVFKFNEGIVMWHLYIIREDD